MRRPSTEIIFNVYFNEKNISALFQICNTCTCVRFLFLCELFCCNLEALDFTWINLGRHGQSGMTLSLCSYSPDSTTPVAHHWANVILASGPTLAQQWHTTFGPPVGQRYWYRWHASWATGGPTSVPPLGQ